MTVNLSLLGGAGAQFFNDNGKPLSGGKLWSYAAGTTTPQATYTSVSGATPHANPIILDAAGRVPGGEIWLTFATSYKFTLTSFTDVPVATWDDIVGGADDALGLSYTPGPSSLLTSVAVADALDALSDEQTGSSFVGFIQDGVNAVPRTSQNKMRDFVSVKDFGAVGDGVADDTAAIQVAISYQISSGATIIFPSGSYLTNGILIAHDNACIHFSSDVSLIAANSNIILFHQAASFANHSGVFNAVGNSKANVTGMACAPSNLTDVTTLYQVNHNIMPGIRAGVDIETAVLLQNGPKIGAVDSGCFYNVFPYGRVRGSTGMILINDSADLVNGPPCNRNRFYNFRAGTESGVSCNYGIYIKAGDTNNFFNCDFEGIGSGTSKPGPLATPTALVINQSSASGADNNHNLFIGGQCEANTRDIDCKQRRSYFIGFGYADSKAVFTNGYPTKRIPARDSSTANTTLLGFRAIDEINTVIDGGVFGDAITPGVGTGRYNWVTYPINTTTLFQNGSLVPSVAQTASFYQKLFGMVTWHFRVAFRANAGTGSVTIALPLEAQNNLYVAPGSAQTMKFPIRISDGVTQQMWWAQINGTDLEIESPGAWNTVSNVNAIWVQLQYFAAV